jgi:hypothetical protein
MRTAFFIEETSSVTIGAADPRDAGVELFCYHGQATPAVGKHALDPGIYLIVSNGSMGIDGVRGSIQVVANNKDDWPDPSPHLVGLEPGASTASIKEFLTVAKDESLDG